MSFIRLLFSLINLRINKETKKIAKAVTPIIIDEEVSFPEYKSDVFTLKPFKISSNHPDFLEKLKGCYGIYVFVIYPEKPTITIPVLPQVNDYGEYSVAPFIRGKRDCYYDKSIQWFTPLKCGQVLYLGKAEVESLQTRLNQHLTNPPSKQTSSLRLDTRQRNYLFGNLICMCFVLNVNYCNNKDYILRKVEKKLHEEKNPRAGSSRS